MKKDKIFFLTLLIIGSLIRVWLARFAYNDLRFDFATYESLAKDFLEGRLAIDGLRKTSGYSAFLALVYSVFGFGNYKAVEAVQIFLDLCNGVLIYFAAKAAFSTQISKIVFLLYMLNPLTSSYTGIILPEILSIFFISVGIFIVSRPGFGKHWHYWVGLGFTLGLLVFTRSQYLFASILLIPVLTWFTFEKRNRLIFFLLSALGIILASSYTLYGNYKLFRLISVTPPFQSAKVMMHDVFTRTGPYPEVPQEFKGDDPVRLAILLELFQTPAQNMKELDRKYGVLLIEKLQQNWPTFLKNYLLSIYWIWDKRHLYYYQDPWYVYDHWLVKVGNIIILFTSLSGLILAFRNKLHKQTSKNIFFFSLVFLITASFLYPLVSYESRHTLSLYGLIFLWSGYGLASIFQLRK